MKNSAADGVVDGHNMPSTVTIAILCELFALFLSFTANMVSVWDDGVIARCIAGAIPIALLGGTYLFLSDRVPIVWWGKGWVSWYSTIIAGIGLLGPAAIASFYHQRELLIATGTPEWLAWLLPFTVDGLALRAALTLFRHNRQPAEVAVSAEVPLAVPAEVAVPAVAEVEVDSQPTDHQPEPPAEPVEDVDSISQPQSLTDDSELLADARRVLADDPGISNQRLADALNTTKYKAARCKRDLRREEEQAI